jgi:hypothetical protein
MITIADCYGPYELIRYFLNPISSAPLCQSVLGTRVEYGVPQWWVYLLIFFLTVGLELLVYLISLKGLSLKTKLKWCFLANISTHPAVVFGFPFLGMSLGWNTSVSLLVSEMFAIIVETFILRRVSGSYATAFFLSFFANMFSWSAGLQLLKPFF